ncbi:hypothetical protein DPMN_001091 [Dreissena polymorpha]|uniref:Myb/SANT-like DNA-binding domain-containing protein n=1 Tax=Dreissena polymorpha TaxID=45954 RepID=A0A9D4RQK0_DREPO|nr:hypothetical protein DPMN_001091 [Dreissena polymorpha]
MADELAMTIARVFSENSLANNMASRSSNWTKEETEILVDGYVENREVFFKKFSCKITNEEKEKKFGAILES